MILKSLGSIKIDNRSGYSHADAAMLLKLIFHERMGRPALTKAMSLGEATVKTMIKNLSAEGLMESSARGQILTEKGTDLARRIDERISQPVKVSLPSISEKPSVAFIVRKARTKINKGIEQRDEGVKQNVDVTTLIFEKGKIRFPDGRSTEVDELESSPEEGDVIILSSGKSISEAIRGGFAVALALI